MDTSGSENESGVLTVSVILDNTGPSITGLSNDLIPKKSKTWNWSSDDLNALYRYSIDQNPDGLPEGEYSDINTATQSSGDGTYYLHVQAKDEVGNVSSVQSVSTILDNTDPIITILGINPITIYKDSSYVDDGALANDNMDGDLTSYISILNNVDVSNIGQYFVNYYIIDSSENSIVASRVVNVISRPSVSEGGGCGGNNYNYNQNNENLNNKEEKNDNKTNEAWTTGRWIKTRDSSTVYLVDTNNDRHAYPNQDIWRSYFDKDFSFVEIVSKEELASYKLSKNVPYNKGTLIKISTIPKVYLVEDNNTIRWIKTENTAKRLYGNSWSKLIHDLPDALFGDYKMGSDKE